ncbi:type IV pilin protein [Teredinibacter turnerae]|uniref:type IV pilin protein n=1 Tax=Teredinibacter turnerae TaxID=2426 RepID=UPI0003F8DD23|nr:type IV pilin protein [Teredinibacter turnerae]
MKHSVKRQQGFTLVEIMIVVVIIAILAGIAYPSYQNSVRKGNRAEGIEALLSAAQRQEMLYSQTNAYSTNAQPFAPVAATETTPSGNYVISVARGDCGTSACFRATATAQGVQANDSECLTLSIDNLGNKMSTPAGGRCWR